MYNAFIVPYIILDIISAVSVGTFVGLRKSRWDFSQSEIFALPGTSK